ncbi:MAG: alpha/beta hydrolase [Betaproteobacteria bacterium]|nr:alpha/beta hydrolase [Betaproteobacteria bacterium]
MKFLVQNQPCYAYTGGKPFHASKPALVFIHGAANDHSVWHLQARYFAHHGWNVLAVDLPGHGFSDGKPRATIREYSQWVIAFLDNANIRTAALVGHSMGSLIALETAIGSPERVSQLVLLGASAPMPVSDALLTAARDDTATAIDMLCAWGHGPRARMGSSAVPGVSLTGTYRRLLAKAGAGVLHNDLAACAAYAAPALADMKVRTLILIGEKDQMTPPRAGASLVAALPNARSVMAPGAGHGMMYEAPDETLAAMKTFLSDPLGAAD